MKQPFETNGHHGIGVSNPISPDTEEDFSDLKYIDVEAASGQDEEKEGRTRRKRRRLMGGLLVLGVLALALGLFFWMTMGGKKKIDLTVRDRNAQTGGADQQKIDDVTAQAIAEVRNVAPSPSPAVSPAPAASAAPAVSSAPVTIPLGGTVTTVESAPGTSTASASSASEPMKPVGRERNSERSIRCAPVPKLVAALNQTNGAVETVQAARRVPAAFPRETEARVVLPPFGAMLPVRTLGAIYTLRPGLARLELTRDVRGQGWLMKRGTVLVGQQQGSEYDRAYITLMGFIDPDSGSLVKLAGDAIGADGAPGIQGKRRQISSRWIRVLNRIANNAVTLGQAALARGNGVSVYLPNAGSEIGFSSSALSRREFVEVPAGASAYILITDLPKETRGVDPQPLATVGIRGNSGEENNGTLSDAELAELLSTGTPEQIRAALPRMRPELRQIAEIVLKESGR